MGINICQQRVIKLLRLAFLANEVRSKGSI